MIENLSDVISIVVLVIIVIFLLRYIFIDFTKGRINYLKKMEDEYYGEDNADLNEYEE